jgi:hypothetical protein
MQQPVERLSGEPLSIDQLIEYLPALKEVARAQLDNCAKGAAVLHRCRTRRDRVRKANTCDLCIQLSTPTCVYACPHDAAKRVDPRRFFGGGIEAKQLGSVGTPGSSIQHG